MALEGGSSIVEISSGDEGVAVDPSSRPWPVPSVYVGVGVSRTRKWVLPHSIIHQACALGLPLCARFPRSTMIEADVYEDVAVNVSKQRNAAERYKCGRASDKSSLNTRSSATPHSGGSSLIDTISLCAFHDLVPLLPPAV